ncbi:MAG: 3-phosphoshikimate 1-carboxyvinyltransferase [Actinobacteria bacterium]|nr:3-phosphoshikimate 1-carboxyvinyltransferase [Actinomycetota bacterium]MBV9255404.1 3-phosphoshikimate 1-carboxyvinyltransferase [Actinomycetota bacterium]
MSSFAVEGGQPLRGRIWVPGDKSISHRALILAARAEGTSSVRGLSNGDDVRRTAAAVVQLGAEIDGHQISGGRERLHAPGGLIDVGNSGTSMRLLSGFCAALPWRTELRGDASVDKRPMDRVITPLRQMGARIDDAYPPLAIDGGGLTGIDYTVPMASSQVKGCVLLAGVGAEGETVVREHVATRPHTEEMLAACGADIEIDGLTIRLRPSKLEPFELDVPGDPSQAAFWVVGASITPKSDVTVEGVYLGPSRTGFLGVLQRMGANVESEADHIHARYAPLHGTEVHADEIPSLDEVPILAVAAAAAEGVTRFCDVAELRIKESNRLATIISELGALGVSAEEDGDDLIVHGGGLRPGTVDSHGDHRIAMAMAIAGASMPGRTVVEGWDAVATSYPEFEDHLAACAS